MSSVEKNKLIYGILLFFVFVFIGVLVLYLIYYLTKTNNDWDKIRNMPLFWLTIVIGLIFIINMMSWIINCRMYVDCGCSSLLLFDICIKISMYIGIVFFISVILLASKLS